MHTNSEASRLENTMAVNGRSIHSESHPVWLRVVSIEISKLVWIPEKPLDWITLTMSMQYVNIDLPDEPDQSMPKRLRESLESMQRLKILSLRVPQQSQGNYWKFYHHSRVSDSCRDPEQILLRLLYNRPIQLPNLGKYDIGVKEAISVWKERRQVLPFKFKFQLDVVYNWHYEYAGRPLRPRPREPIGTGEGSTVYAAEFDLMTRELCLTARSKQVHGAVYHIEKLHIPPAYIPPVITGWLDLCSTPGGRA